MNIRYSLILVLALVMALTFTLGLPGGAGAQQNYPAGCYGPAGQNSASGYYAANGNGYAYCPMGSGYGYSAPATRDYQNRASRSRHSGYRGTWGPNSGYARGYRSGWGSCW